MVVGLTPWHQRRCRTGAERRLPDGRVRQQSQGRDPAEPGPDVQPAELAFREV